MAMRVDDARRRGMRAIIAAQMFGMLCNLVFTGNFLTLFLVHLKMSEAMIGVTSALWRVLLPVQVLMAGVIDRTGKRAVLNAGLGTGLLAALPLLAYPELNDWLGGRGLAVLIVVVITVYSAASQAGFAAWFPLLHDVVPESIVGRFLGTMRTGWHLSSIVFFLVVQFWAGQDAGDGFFRATFAAALAGGLVRLVLIQWIPERPARGTPAPLGAFVVPLRDGVFRRYMGYMGAVNLTFHMMLPFMVVAMRERLLLPASFVVLCTVAQLAAGVVSLYGWGRVADRWGSRFVFASTSVGLALMILPWAALRGPVPGIERILIVLYFLLYLFALGNGIADTQTLLRLTPPERQAHYIILATVVSGAASSVGPIVAGVLLELLPERPLWLGLDRFQWLFLFNGIGALATLAWLPKVTRRATVGAGIGS